MRTGTSPVRNVGAAGRADSGSVRKHEVSFVLGGGWWWRRVLPEFDVHEEAGPTHECYSSSPLLHLFFLLSFERQVQCVKG